MASQYTLVLFTAQWCDPGIPMRRIFDETLRDLARLRSDITVEGVVVDIDDEEVNQQTAASAPRVSTELLASIDFVPIISLVEGDALVGNEIARMVGQLPKLVIRQKIIAALPEVGE